MPSANAHLMRLQIDGRDMEEDEAFARQMESLEASVHVRCAELVQKNIVDELHRAGHSMGISELSRRTELPRDSVRRALHDLMAEGRVWGVVDGQQALFAVETVGPCDWCGVVDHHLVAGECPRCRHKRH